MYAQVVKSKNNNNRTFVHSSTNKKGNGKQYSRGTNYRPEVKFNRSIKHKETKNGAVIHSHILQLVRNVEFVNTDNINSDTEVRQELTGIRQPREAYMGDDHNGQWYSGNVVVRNIRDGSAVYSHGASTCVIIFMEASLTNRDWVAAFHMAVDDDPTVSLNRMKNAILGNLAPDDPVPLNFDVYCVGGMEEEGVENGDIERPLRDAIVADQDLNLVSWEVPVNEEDDESGGIDAGFSSNGLKWTNNP